MSKMRLVFNRCGHAIHWNPFELPLTSGCSTSGSTDITGLIEAMSIVGNLGNMVHRQAIIDILDFDRANSLQVNFIDLLKQRPATEVAAFVNDNFDGFVITFSNDLRPGVTDFGLTSLIEKLNVPIFVFGLGGQYYESTVLSSKMLRLLKVLNERASIFGVRGHGAEQYLKSLGFVNALALGCPSLMYLAKLNKIRNFKYKKIDTNKTNSVFVAGRMVPFSSPESRTGLLVSGLNRSGSSNYVFDYVFQDELVHYKGVLLEKEGAYIPSLGLLNRELITEHLKNSALPINFNNYFCFSNVEAWRQRSSFYDMYVGDRIHGGVVALQAGVPSLILYMDDRVKELCHYHGIPACTLLTFSRVGITNAISEFLNEETLASMQNRLMCCLNKFSSTLRQKGLELVI